MEDPTSDAQKKDMMSKDGMMWDPDTLGPLYRGSDCCFNSCTTTSDHYHCQVCGTTTTEVSQALAHMRTSSACRKDPTVHYPACSVAMATDAANSLYNAIYSGFTAQNSYPPAGFSGYSQLDSFQWHPPMPEKVAICSSQLSPCCSSNGGAYIPVESQLCSPIGDLYSKVTTPMRDLVSLPAKSTGSTLDSQAWFATYNPQQIQKPSYKFSDQNASASSQINFLMLDPDPKHQDVNSSPIGDSSLNLPSSFCRKTDLGVKDLLKESYCSYTSQSIPGVLSEDALFALQLPDEALKQVELHHVHQQPPLPSILLSDGSIPGKNTSQIDVSASSSRTENHFTQEHFGQYMSNCNEYPPALENESQSRESKEMSNQTSSAASDSDESDIIVEDTGDDLGAQMTESEIFIEDIKCSLLQGVVGEEEVSSRQSLESFSRKVGSNLEQSSKTSKENLVMQEIQSSSPLKNCVSSYHSLLKCVVCEKSVSDDDPGSVFVQMSNQMPLTTISQTPVLVKLNEVMASELPDFLDINGKFMCQNCFNLVDTFDSLESKLESLKQNITALVKTGSKALTNSVNHCGKLPVDLIEQNQSSMLNQPPQELISNKITSASVCVQDVQQLYQTSLAPNNTRPLGCQKRVNHQEMTKDPEQKEYLLLSSRALTLVNSMEKVDLSLSQHQPEELVNEEHCTSYDNLCHVPKISDVSAAPQRTTKIQPISDEGELLRQQAQLFTSHHETLPASNLALGLCTNKSMEPCRKSKEENVELSRLRRGTIGKQGEECVGMLDSKISNEQPEENQYHSSDCTAGNCHEILVLQRQAQDSLRKESSAQLQLKFACDLCPEVFSSNKYLEDHLFLYSKSDPALCELCGKLYHDQTCLDDHVFFVHFIYLKHCEFCKKKFSHPCMYNNHIRTHEDEKLLSISDGSHSFAFSSNAEAPDNTRLGPLVLPHLQLEQHTKARQEHRKKTVVKCDKCERTFMKPSDLQAHKRSHTSEKNFECKICGRFYKSLGNLNHHAKSHASEKPYTCKFCSQGFVRKEFFETHLNSHKGEKPYKCEKCQKGFWSKSYLQVHLKWHMDKTKKVTCPICQKSYSQRLNVHMRSHTGERPHSCQQCSRKFVTNSALRKHLKQVHNQKLLTKETYSYSCLSKLDNQSNLDEPDSLSSSGSVNN